MPLIDRDGVFKGRIVEHSVGKTKNGFPQFVARFHATQIFDADQNEWIDWSQYDQEMIGYAVLANDQGKLFKHDQVKDATGWDGKSFAGLATMDLSIVECQFQVDWHDYDGKKTLQVSNLGKGDGPVLGGLRGATSIELDDMDRRFLGKTVTPATPKAPPAAPPKTTASTKKSTKTASASTAVSKPGMTKVHAWKQVNDLKLPDDCDDPTLRKAWNDSIAEVGSDETVFTGEQWEQVAKLTLEKIPSLPV